MSGDYYGLYYFKAWSVNFYFVSISVKLLHEDFQVVEMSMSIQFYSLSVMGKEGAKISFRINVGKKKKDLPQNAYMKECPLQTIKDAVSILSYYVQC